MTSLIAILLFANLAWTSYLTYLFYIKNQKKIQPAICTDNTIVSQQISRQLEKTIQKVAVVRFNPFDDLGGDQSFILALLDNTNSGVIITSLHNRDNTRVYAKPIKKGHGDGIALSRDELLTVQKAIKDL